MTDKDGAGGEDDKGSVVLESALAFLTTWGILVFYLGRKGMMFGWIPGIVMALLLHTIPPLVGKNNSLGCVVVLIAILGAAVWFFF